MQEIATEILLIAAFAVGVGTLSSMIGIGGGIINTPILVIVFGLTTDLAPSSSLVAAMFVAISSTWVYHRQTPSPNVYAAGLFLAITTIPGSWVGGWLRLTIFNVYGDDALRWVFAILLFPIAMRMLFAKRKGSGDWAADLAAYDFSRTPRATLILALIGAFGGGIVANLLGLGGGVIIVPVLIIILGLPMHAAVATSMFTMLFTTGAGTLQNVLSGSIDVYFSFALGLGMVIGAQFGPRLAIRVDSVRLKQIFGLVLVYPLVRMVRAGQMLLDPTGTDFMLTTLGDVLVWMVIIIPIGIMKLALNRKVVTSGNREENDDVPFDS
ncbi:MAG: sulfite exporter TauE/SafE family protein [Candidatus Thorarchaeota archaeon]